MHNVIACGHKLTAHAAKEVIDQGGNAFDGIVAACFASCVTEPMLTSLAGGGIGLLKPSSGDIKCVDFLTNFPTSEKHVDPVKKVVSFGGETQAFYLGFGSLGTPGSLDGLLHIHKEYCTIELDKIISPAIRFAEGHELNRLQAFTFQILKAFCFYSEESIEVFAPSGTLLKEGDIIRNKKLADFLRMIAEDENAARDLYYESLARTIEGKESTLSMQDVRSYKVNEKEPVLIDYHGHDIALPSPPSAGGVLVAHSLKYIEEKNVGRLAHNSPEHVSILIDAMKECDSQRTEKFFRGLLFEENFWKKFLKRPDRLGGTTHISVIDSEGNAAGITTSNGQGAGVMIDNTGIMLNNFAAEPDLMRHREIYKPGERITSMMTPTMISQEGKLEAVLGTGGSNRIRSAVLQSISNLIDFGMTPQEATDASRVHFENNLLQLEYGIEGKFPYKTNVWTDKNLFFGGVHIAALDAAGGDSRRGGSVSID